MRIEYSLTKKGDRLSDWLSGDYPQHDRPFRFRQFHWRLMRWGGIPFVTVVERTVAKVEWGEGDPSNCVVLSGLTDAQMVRLCFDCSFLSQDQSDATELKRLKILMKARDANREGMAGQN